VSDFEDYEVNIDDWNPTIHDLTKLELITIINKKLGKKWTYEDLGNGISLEVKPEWEKILREDGSVLWEYTKLGWKAMHYIKTNQDGKVTRNWLNFKSLNYKGKKK